MKIRRDNSGEKDTDDVDTYCTHISPHLSVAAAFAGRG